MSQLAAKTCKLLEGFENLKIKRLKKGKLITRSNTNTILHC
jgi:hypothetical protein